MKSQKESQDTSRSHKAFPQPVRPDIRIAMEKTEEGGKCKRFVAYDKEQNRLGSITYTVNGSVLIDLIIVHEDYQRKGVGTTLIDRLAREYGYHNLTWGFRTEYGHPFKEAMDKRHHDQICGRMKREVVD